ncbi:MAG: isochorismatase family protein, partial [Alphaproteobacteria bacterium]
MVPLAAKPEPVVVDLAQTALVVVDMQNAFLSKGGMFDLAGFDLSGAAKAIEVNQHLLTTVRAAGVKVVYLQMTYRADLSDAGGPSSPNYHKELGMVMMRDRPELTGTLITENT